MYLSIEIQEPCFREVSSGGCPAAFGGVQHVKPVSVNAGYRSVFIVCEKKPYYYIYSSSAEIFSGVGNVFRFCRLKSIPALSGLKLYTGIHRIFQLLLSM